MNLTRFLDSTSRFCMAEDGGASGGASDGAAPSKVSTDTNSNASASATVGTTAGEVAQASGNQSSASASVPASVGTDTTKAEPATGDFRSDWPDDLKKDPYLSGFKTPQDLAKALAENKKLIGQKLGIPTKESTPEAAAAFWEGLGVPKEPAGYELKVPDDLPEPLKASYDEANAQKWADIFKKNNVPKETANALRNELFSELKKEMEGVTSDIAKSDEEFGKMAAKIYGDNAKADQALQSVRTMVEKHVPAELKGAIGELSNSALLIMAATIRGETIALSGEDKTISRDNGDTGSGKSVDQLREEAREIMASPEYQSPVTKGKVAHDDAKKKVADIYKRIGEMRK